MNSTVPQSYIDAHLADDAARASSEYLAMFRSDLEAFVSREVVEACVGDFYELSPVAGRSYYEFVDPAGGSGGDAFALAISHREGQSVVVDLVRERRPPFMPSQVIDELGLLLKAYRIGKVVGDKWAGGFPPEAFQRGGIRYEPSKQAKSDLYRDALPLLNSGRIVLPKNDRLFNQLVSLERHVARGGHDVIDHPRDQHDDLANAAMGAAVLAGSFGGYTLEMLTRAFSTEDEDPNTEAAREARDQEYRNQFAARIFALSGGSAGLGDATMNLTEANHILRLTDRQLAIVRQAAVPLSPSARDRYLKTVAAELAEAERVDDATVKAVVETVLCTLVDR